MSNQASSLLLLCLFWYSEVVFAASKSDISKPALNHIEPTSISDSNIFTDLKDEESQVVEPEKHVAKQVPVGHAKSRVISLKPKMPVLPEKRYATSQTASLNGINKPIVDAGKSKKSNEMVISKSLDNQSTKTDPKLVPFSKSLTIEPINEVTQGLRIEDIVDEEQVYEFAGAEKPDPFLAPIGDIEEEGLAQKDLEVIDADEIPIVSPLQYHDLKSLVVSGVWESETGVWKALIETPDRQGIIAKAQDPVGNGGGRITAIAPDGVKVREYRLRSDGSQEFFDRVISMARDDGALEQMKGGSIIIKPGAKNTEVRLPEGLVETKDGLMMDGSRKDKVSGEAEKSAKNDVKLTPEEALKFLEYIKR